MYNLYYSPPSASFLSNVKVVSSFPDSFQQQTWTNVTLEISASSYDTFDSSSTYSSTTDALRVYIRSGSLTYISFPLEETTIYYSQSFYPYIVPSSSTTFNVTYRFNPSTVYTSSNDKFIILSGSVSSSIVSQSSAVKSIPLEINTNYNIVLSGSGDFYTSSLTIYETTTNTLISYITSSNSPISTTLSSSVTYPNYVITAVTTPTPVIKITFSSSVNIPVVPTSSLSAWNTYLNITASSISSSGTTFYLFGGDLGITTSPINIEGSSVKDFYIFGLDNITNCSLDGNLISSFPNTLLSSSNLQYIDVSFNRISGSIPNISLNPNINTFFASTNKLSGSIPSLTSSINLKNFDIGFNYLTGAILLPNSGNLEYFDAKYNRLSGSVNLENSPNLQYFDVSNNYLSGGLESLTNNYNLQHFDVSNNYLSGGIDIEYLSYLQYYNVRNNRLSGSINSFANSSLLYFNCSNNTLSGSFPTLQTIDLAFSDSSSLQYYNISSNHFSGTIDITEYYNSLQTFICNNNKLTKYTSNSPSLPLQSLTYFNAANNLLSSSAVDAILYDLNLSGLTSGSASLGGTGNAAPSATGLTYTASLKSKGWSITVN